MAHWELKINLAPEVRKYEDGEVGIEELAQKVVAKIKETRWRSFSPYPHTWDDTVDRLLQATSEGEYQAAFEYIYELADEDRVWIETS